MMNPIFSRRYKGGSRPNIMPTAAKRQNYMKSMSTTGSNGGNSSGGSSGSSGIFSTQSISDSGEENFLGDIKSPDREEDCTHFFTKSSSHSKTKGHHYHHQTTGKVNSSSSSAAADAATSRLLAQQLLASKQNMLAELNLTPQENRQRAKFSGSGGNGKGEGEEKERGKLVKTPCMRQSFSTESFSKSLSMDNGSIGGYYNGMQKSPTVHNIGNDLGDMTLCDLEDIDDIQAQGNHPTDYNTVYSTASASSYTAPIVSNSRISRPNLNQRISKESLDVKQWRELKRVVSGNGNFHDGWIGQGFTFDTKIPFGLVQKKGGPCGVLAVVQSLVIRNLLFGSSFSPENNERNAKLAEIANFLQGKDNEMEDGAVVESIRKDRVDCLVDAVAEILWACGNSQQQTSRSRQSDQERSTLIMFSDFRIQPEVICVKGRLELQHFLRNSIHRFDCIALVYSAVLTRGISGVKEDMDFENCSLIGQHGYCSQELINLLAIGRAISNTFDNEIELDGKVLKGIPDKCNVGLLSLFEHYDSIKVGGFLKCPLFPVWMICSESHFSVMFSCQLDLCMEEKTGEGAKKDKGDHSFDLFYYDGLSRQEKIIRLSILMSSHNLHTTRNGQYSYNTPADNHFSSFSSSSGSKGGGNRDEDLIPPLEKCIRTKWRGALIDWNDTEPIL